MSEFISFSKLSTDKLCDLITNHIKIPLPAFNYKKNKYVSKVCENESLDCFHDSFREGCLRIIFWYLEKNNS